MKQITWQQAQSLIDCTEELQTKYRLITIFGQRILTKRDVELNEYDNELLSSEKFDLKVTELYKSFFKEPKKEEVKFEFGKEIQLNDFKNIFHITFNNEEYRFVVKHCGNYPDDKFNSIFLGLNFKTKEQAEHMAEYLQLAMEIKAHCDYLNELDGFVADWGDVEQVKFGLGMNCKLIGATYTKDGNLFLFNQYVSSEQRAKELLSIYKERIEKHFKINQ